VTSAWLWFRAAIWFLIAPGMIGILIPHLIATSGGEPPPAPAPVRIVAMVLFFAGLAVLVWCFALFVIRGRGTPDPSKPPTHIVTSGPYRFSRNPMYVAVMTMVLGAFISTGHMGLAVYLVALMVIFHLRVTRFEEPWCARTFGSAFDDYRRRVPRWLGRTRSP
jgi:protein-S-isoprenylcysteine O-methyltransferase Ste14